MDNLGIEIPAALVNDNVVQDAAARLRSAITMGCGVEKARANLQAWIDYLQR